MTATIGPFTVVLICDSPGCTRRCTNDCDSPATPSDASALRRQAAAEGWGRFRPHANWPLGDYCPEHVAEILRRPL